MPSLKSIKAALLDLDGTLYIEGKWILGAKETLEVLLKKKIQLRFITNSTLNNRRQIQERFRKLGFQAPIEWFYTPARVAYAWIKEQNFKSGIFPLVHSNLKEDLEGLPLTDDENADCVLVGEMEDELNNEKLNLALRCLKNGAKLTALQKNRFWMSKTGIKLDCGPFVAALEYGAQVECEALFGKPNPLFFQTALKSTGVSPDQSMMVGDDLESDVLGAQACGMIGVQVKTGKFLKSTWGEKLKQASYVIDSITDLAQILR